MQTIKVPRVGARVRMKNNPELQGYVKEIALKSVVVSIPRPDLGDGISQEVLVYQARVDWDDPRKVGFILHSLGHGFVSGLNLEVINPHTPKETLESLRQMVRRRQKAMGNDAFLVDEILQEVDMILKGKV